ncbi:hypothetical protein [Bradyrhizobium erythrophlei]|uniref:Uncharacterized protein n=1 Tax=Bradyrhizobium erythrophlei TaxID=1437360 RepID=A0A1H4Q2V1_9BRAD|nr:hypothetical protein [Bradyrhizobium erythrophlei]SEC13931.1 hypothetical protein SAMN05444164_1123 [Bradyrhizobium erythrophlei]
MGLIVPHSDQSGVAFARFGYGDCRTTEVGRARSLVLVLDLDGTLIKDDLFDLSLFSSLCRNPLLIVHARSG